MNWDSKVFDFFLSITANFVTTVLALGIAFFWTQIPKRRQRAWMGFSELTERTEILTSNIQVLSGGTAPLSGETTRRGFQGTAIDESEYRSAIRLHDALEPSRLADIFSTFFRKRIPPTTVNACPREWRPAEHRQNNLILVGSPVYNSGTKYILDQTDVVKFRKVDGQRRIEIRDHWYARPLDENGFEMSLPDYGIIGRRFVEGRSVFLCFGIGNLATCAAVEYLAEKWEQLERDCGRDEFIALVEVTSLHGTPFVTYLHRANI